MIRCTIEILPGGNESRARTIGRVEIANVGSTEKVGNYAVVLTKTPPFAGALKAAWRKGALGFFRPPADVLELARQQIDALSAGEGE